jgi:uncharacterized protein
MQKGATLLQNKQSEQILYLLPLILPGTAILVFLGAARLFGKEWGYLTGFIFYWLLWCILFPGWILRNNGGWRRVLQQEKAFFSIQQMDAVLLFLIITGVTIWMYWENFIRASLTLILLSIPIAALNGFCEEALWRGLYNQVFPGDWLRGLVLPSIGFAFWHIAPQLIFPSDRGIFPFVLSTFFLGLAYGWIAFRTGSARWTAISHSLSGVIAVGGPITYIVYKLFF